MKVQQNEEYIVAGTVFRSILVWKTNTATLVKGGAGKDVERETAGVLYRLQGHTGVIFDVKFMKSGLDVVSVSDDRSIRVWEHPAGSGEAEYSQKHEFYGHRSRVWAVR